MQLNVLNNCEGVAEKNKERLSGVSIPTLRLKHPFTTLQTLPPPQTNNAEVAARGRRQSW